MGKDKDKKKRDEQNLKILLELLQEPDNQKCADCGERNPRWASTTLGVFLCIQCGGHHRKLGTSISKVKSVTLDSWSDEAISTMRQWGNKRANDLYCPDTRKHPPPAHSDREMEAYIRMKYEKMMFANGQSRALQADAQDVESYTAQLRTLATMGFTNQPRAIKALKKANGQLDAAIDLLVNDPTLDDPVSTRPSTTSHAYRPSTTHTSTADYSSQSTQLEAMGFTDVAQNKMALARTKGNIEEALNILVELQKDQPALPPPPKRQSTIKNERPTTATATATAKTTPHQDLLGDLDFFSPPANLPTNNGFSVYQHTQPTFQQPASSNMSQYSIPPQQQQGQFSIQPPPMNPNARSLNASQNNTMFQPQSVANPFEMNQSSFGSNGYSNNMTNTMNPQMMTQPTLSIPSNPFSNQNGFNPSMNVSNNSGFTQSMNASNNSGFTQSMSTNNNNGFNPVNSNSNSGFNPMNAINTNGYNPTNKAGFTNLTQNTMQQMNPQQPYSQGQQPNPFNTSMAYSAPKQNVNKDLSGLFDPVAAPPQNTQPSAMQTRPVDPAAKKDAILSLFNQPAPSYQQGMQHQGIGMSTQFAPNPSFSAVQNMQTMAMKPGFAPPTANPFQQAQFNNAPQTQPNTLYQQQQQRNPFGF